MTKEELMAKGLSPQAADEVIASFAGEKSGSPLLELNKALKGDKEDSLFKAEDEDEDEGKKKSGDDEDEDEDDDDLEKGETLDEDEEDLEKAISVLSSSGEGAVVEMADLSPFLRAFTKQNEKMCKAVSTLVAENKTIKAQNAELYGLMHKAASVQAATAEVLEKAMSVPTGRRGVTTVPVQDMQKASQSASDGKTVYSTLSKAMNTGDKRAGFILSAYESAGKRVEKLDQPSRDYISELIKKGE